MIDLEIGFVVESAWFEYVGGIDEREALSVASVVVLGLTPVNVESDGEGKQQAEDE